MIVRDYWETAAEHYDPNHASRREDVEFWVSVANQHGGPVLEIACGTGRVGLEIARQGHDYTGVDLSEPLLNLFRGKLAAQPEHAHRRVELHQGDMRTFNLNRQFALALIPFRPLQHMLTLDDQIAALAAARRHLKPGGLLGFDVFFPKFAKLDGPFGVEKEEAAWSTSEGRTVRRSYVRHSVDKINQVLYGSFIFRLYQGERLVSEEASRLNMSFFTYPHLRLLLERTGFRIDEEYGSYTREPLSVEKEIILLARAV